MRIKYFPLLFLASLLVVGGASITPCSARVIFEDDFSGDPGTPLNGREPAIANTDSKTYVTYPGIVLLGERRMGTLGRRNWGGIELPPLSGTETLGIETIVVTIELRPANSDGADNWMGVGFTDRSGDLIGFGAPWVLLSGGDLGGKVSVFSGPATEGTLYASSQREPTAQGESPSILKLTYNVGSGDLRVELGEATVFNGVISYKGKPSSPVPLDALRYVSFEWYDQDTSADELPGFISKLKVEVLSEP